MVDMGTFNIGDVVARKSYGLDILFKIVDAEDKGTGVQYVLKGVNYRILADAPENDLVPQNEYNLRQERKKFERKIANAMRRHETERYRGHSKKRFVRNTPKEKDEEFFLPGKILHIDGDSDYLDTCMEKYGEFNLECVGKHIPESKQPARVAELLREHKPDILVLTGHDSITKGKKEYKDLGNYRNTRYFIEAVREARRHEPSLDDLAIFAGACQSNYQALLTAGANFASSPRRVLIHALDPVLVCQKIAYTAVDRMVSVKDVINNTVTGAKGIGGVQTRGKYREGFPRETYNGE